MQLTIRTDSRDFKESFIYDYLPLYIYKMFLLTVDRTRLSEFDNFFNINSFSILSKALRNLLISKNGSYEYIISINKTLKEDGILLVSWINVITYGNREVKGYPLLIDLFNGISDDIGNIYREWVGD